MKQLKIAAGVVLGLAIVVFVLLSNKSKIKAGARSDKLTSIPVTLHTAAVMKLTKPFSLVGTISANNDVAVVAETQGRVTAVMANTGDFVEAGAVIVKVDDEIRHAAFELAKANFEKARRDLDRNEELYKDRTITEAQIEQSRLAFRSAENQFIVARRQLDDTRITSPISGFMTERKVNMGTMVMPGMSIANVVDVSRLKVKLNLSEKDAFRVKVGDKVMITTEVYSGVDFSGRVSSISAKADDAHTYPVEIELANSSKYPLRSGMFGLVHFETLGVDETVAIPRDAIIGSIKEPQVYVVADGVASLRKLTVGDDFDGMVAVKEGLKSGDKVVLSGHGNLSDGSAVTVLR